MLLDYILPIIQDSINTDKVRGVNHHYISKFQSHGNSQSEQLFAISGYWRALRGVDTSMSKSIKTRRKIMNQSIGLGSCILILAIF